MLGTLFGRKKSIKEDKATPLSPALLDSIVSIVGTRGIPPMPGAAQKAFQLATDPKAEAKDFIEVIESDEGLSARILKIANSVYFDRGKQSKTIEESVVVIGINELRCLLNATTLSEIFPSSNPARAQLWANDIATAIVSRTLAQRILPSKTDLAFLSGLMHDVGKLLLVQRAAEEYKKVLVLVEMGQSFCDAEEQTFLFNHTHVGQLIAQRWNFSQELTQVIRHHHDGWDAHGPMLVTIVKAADCIAHSLGLGHGRGFVKLKNSSEAELEKAWDTLSIAASERKDVLELSKRTFDVEYDLYSGKASK